MFVHETSRELIEHHLSGCPRVNVERLGAVRATRTVGQHLVVALVTVTMASCVLPWRLPRLPSERDVAVHDAGLYAVHITVYPVGYPHATARVVRFVR